MVAANCRVDSVYGRAGRIDLEQVDVLCAVSLGGVPAKYAGYNFSTSEPASMPSCNLAGFMLFVTVPGWKVPCGGVSAAIVSARESS